MEQVFTSLRPLPEHIDATRSAIDRLDQRQQELLEGINRKMKPAKRLLEKLLLEKRHRETESKLSHPQTIDDLLLHPSYENDADFAPSDLDTERHDKFLQRTDMIGKIKHDLWVHGGGKNYWGYRVTNGQELVDAVQKKIDRFGAMNALQRWWNRDKREAFDVEMAKLLEEIMVAPERFAAAKNSYAALETELTKWQEQKDYDRLLQFAEMLRFLPRTEQSVLMTYTHNDQTFTLHLPSTSTERDFTQTVSFTLDSREVQEFCELIGNNLKTEDHSYTVSDIDLDVDVVDGLLVPFPLEIVIQNSQERLRIPKAVWDRFGESAHH